MKIEMRWAVAAVALLAAGCDQKDAAPGNESAAANVAAPAADTLRDWTATVSKTAAGGYVMGNPDAAVKLVEYASLTCPHCADFSTTGTAKLRDYVKSGRVSWEFRNFVLNPIDVTASALARCQGEGPFFKLTEQLYATQAEWAGKFQSISEAEANRIGTLPQNRQFLALAKAGGLDGFFRARGMPEAKVAACLTEQAAIDELVAIRERGTNEDKVTGTPAFLINGVLQEGVFDWPSLETKIKEAL